MPDSNYLTTFNESISIGYALVQDCAALFYLFNNLFASKNITYKNAIQMTLKEGYSQKGLLKAKIK